MFPRRLAVRALAAKAPAPPITIKHAVRLHVILRSFSGRGNLFYVTKSLILSSLKKEGNTKNVFNLLWEIFEGTGRGVRKPSQYNTCERGGNCGQMRHWNSFSTLYTPFQSYFLPVNHMMLARLGKTGQYWWVIVYNSHRTYDLHQHKSFCFLCYLRLNPYHGVAF